MRGPVQGGGSGASIRFLYRTGPGRLLLRLILACHLDWPAVWFLNSPLSRPLIRRYARRHGIAIGPGQAFRSFGAFFARRREDAAVDETPDHLISPCDGWLSAFPIREDSAFLIKGSLYRVEDFLGGAPLPGDKQGGASLPGNWQGGTCLVFRLCPSDYHHYCYIDDGFQGPNHCLPGQLHSVQPAACETYPVFTLNRRSWCLMETDHFGPVVQTEIGALIVGGIRNARENVRVRRGQEKGYFSLSGSTIVLLLERDRVRLLPELGAERGEVKVRQGQWIGTGIRDGAGDGDKSAGTCNSNNGTGNSRNTNQRRNQERWE